MPRFRTSQRARLGAAVLAVAILAALPTAATASFGDRPLERGDRGHDVRVLQSWLSHLGFETGVDGVFGRGTERTVKRYEAHEKLKRDGIVSRAQARRMRTEVESASTGGSKDSYTFGDRTLERGDRGHDVRVLQSWLTHLDVPTDVDGVFGPGTERNVEVYEGREEIREDGKVSKPQAQLMRRQVEEGAAEPVPVDAAGGHVFPVQGGHRYGDGFGAGRAGHSHQGQDIFASCGTPLVAAQGGEVIYRAFHSAAGYYLVIRGAESGQDYVYMHMRHRSSFAEGDTVATGQQIGEVGQSGNAEGCHLHFELWTAPGWYDGGKAIDPLPSLRSWEQSAA